MVHTKIRNRSTLEFRRIQALSICARVYPLRYEALKQQGRLDQALAIGYTILDKLCKHV